MHVFYGNQMCELITECDLQAVESSLHPLYTNRDHLQPEPQNLEPIQLQL
jgi:hypothetical protein